MATRLTRKETNYRTFGLFYERTWAWRAAGVVVVGGGVDAAIVVPPFGDQPVHRRLVLGQQRVRVPGQLGPKGGVGGVNRGEDAVVARGEIRRIDLPLVAGVAAATPRVAGPQDDHAVGTRVGLELFDLADQLLSLGEVATPRHCTTSSRNSSISFSMSTSLPRKVTQLAVYVRMGPGEALHQNSFRPRLNRIRSGTCLTSFCRSWAARSLSAWPL